ncbi:MAG: hypothetical protein RMK57_16740 [Bryobacterales bacterium]|nr:hypothetical protein [Bryobacteraceae bacterium]MDW8356168.1 hypothetical protein [Bryobacterales bacterium]
MPLRARRYLRKMRGGAQAHLLEAEDGHFYVVKFRDNPQGRRILINEWVASVFLRYLELAVPETAVIQVTPEFVRENPELYIQLGSNRQPVRPGWHFGSRYPGDPTTTAVYDFLPDVLLAQVVNRRDFWGMLVADKWLANADGRQAVYFRARIEQPWAGASSEAGFVAQMIDHGFVFNGPEWRLEAGPLHGLAPRGVVYHQVRSLDDFQPWLDRVAYFPDEIVDQALRSVPPEWFEGDRDELELLLERLLERGRKTADRLLECRRARPDWFPNWR